MSTDHDATDIATMRSYVLHDLENIGKQSDARSFIGKRDVGFSIIGEFSDDVVTEMYAVLTSNPSIVLREKLKHACINGRSDRVLAMCRYNSIFFPVKMDISFAEYLKIMDIPERHGYTVSGSIALARRIGMAHAVIVLYTCMHDGRRTYYPERTDVQSLNKDAVYILLEDKYPTLVDVFTAYPEKALDLHEFVAARGYVLNNDMFEAMRIFAESPTAALAEGAL